MPVPDRNTIDYLNASGMPTPTPPAPSPPVDSNIIAKLLNVVSGSPWLGQAQSQTQKDISAFQQGGVPALMADTRQTQQLAGGFGGNTKAVGAPVAGVAQQMWKTTATQEAQKYLSHYKDDLFTAIKAIDSHPFWDHPQMIQRIADIKNALIDVAPTSEINRALKIENDFRLQNGQSYSQYQATVFGNRPSHPHGLTDWSEYFQKGTLGSGPQKLSGPK